MAGIPGMNIGRTRKAAEKDAIALAFLEQKMDEIARNACTCVECGKDIDNKDIPPQAVKVMQMRYDKLRPSLASVTQEVIQHETRSEGDLIGQFRQVLEQFPDVRREMWGVFAEVAAKSGEPVSVDNRPEKPVDAQQQSTCSTDHNEAEQS